LRNINPSPYLFFFDSLGNTWVFNALLSKFIFLPFLVSLLNSFTLYIGLSSGIT
jgi:hypothetical protein